MLRAVGISEKTPYDDWTSNTPMIVILSVIAICSFVYYGLASYILPK